MRAQLDHRKPVLRRALIEHARSLPSLVFLAPIEVGSVAATAAGATAALSDGRQIAIRLVAAADGAGSPLRRACGIRTVNGVIARPRSSRPCITSARTRASRSSIFCQPAHSRSCR